MLVLVALAALVMWLLPLLRMRSRNRSKTVQTIDHRARWGVLLEAVGYGLALSPGLSGHVDFPVWQPPLAFALLVFAVATSMQAAAALGDLLRIDASLSTSHKLIRTGPYRFVRHPVYLSFLCLLIGTGLLVAAPWWLLGCATAVFLCGTEIRVRIEDAMLARHFGAEFDEYRREVKAYLPGIR